MYTEKNWNDHFKLLVQKKLVSIINYIDKDFAHAGK